MSNTLQKHTKKILNVMLKDTKIKNIFHVRKVQSFFDFCLFKENKNE